MGKQIMLLKQHFDVQLVVEIIIQEGREFLKVSLLWVVGICDDNDEITYWGVRGMRNEIMLITHFHHHHPSTRNANLNVP